MPKLKVCCAARPVFSAADSSVHGTLPLSLKGVTARRRDDSGAAEPPRCVAYRRCPLAYGDGCEGRVWSCCCCWMRRGRGAVVGAAVVVVMVGVRALLVVGRSRSPETVT